MSPKAPHVKGLLPSLALGGGGHQKHQEMVCCGKSYDHWGNALEGNSGILPLFPPCPLLVPGHKVNCSLNTPQLCCTASPQPKSNKASWPWTETSKTDSKATFFFLISCWSKAFCFSNRKMTNIDMLSECLYFSWYIGRVWGKLADMASSSCSEITYMWYYLSVSLISFFNS